MGLTIHTFSTPSLPELSSPLSPSFKMRIVSGQYRGRHFDIPHSFKARPTTDFAKENLFNVLQGYVGFDGAAALDLFSGTGSITYELLSRGCDEVISVEADRDHYAFIRQCLAKLGCLNVRAVRADVFRYLKQCRQQFDIVFADPPYALKQLATLPEVVFEKSVLREGGVFVLEHGKDHSFQQHPRCFDHRQYGSVNFSFFR